MSNINRKEPLSKSGKEFLCVVATAMGATPKQISEFLEKYYIIEDAD